MAPSHSIKELSKLIVNNYQHLVLISDYYINNRTPLVFKCRKHNLKFSASPGTFFSLRAKGCVKCGRESDIEKRKARALSDYLDHLKSDKPNIKFVDNYTHAKDPTLKHVCKLHGEFKNSIEYIRANKYGCPSCAKDAAGLLNRYSTEDYVRTLEKHHGDTYLVLGDYADTWTPILHFCTVHQRPFDKRPNALKQRGCPECVSYGRSTKNSLTDKEFKQRLYEIHRGKITSLTKYSGYNSPVTLKCSECDFTWSSKFPLSTAAGFGKAKSAGCPKCARVKQAEEMEKKGKSKAEVKVRKFVQKYFPTAKPVWFEFEDGTLRQFDIYIPERKLAIEFNGNYWHSYQRRGATYHSEKRKLAEANGFRVIFLWECDWNARKNAAKRLIENSLGVARENIYARKCTVVKFDRVTPEVADFYNANHIQGAPRTGTVYGLTNATGGLIAAMTFTRIQSNRGKTKQETEGCFELSRFATSCQVAGGASKLLTAFERDVDPKEIVSYCDLDYFTGNMYEQLGFKKEKQYTSDYFTVFNGERKHKTFTKRDNLDRLEGFDFNPAISERENLVVNKIPVCYTSGKVKFVKTCLPKSVK